jgi:hypothetical protein
MKKIHFKPLSPQIISLLRKSVFLLAILGKKTTLFAKIIPDG